MKTAGETSSTVFTECLCGVWWVGGVCVGRICVQISLENEDRKEAYGRYLRRISQGF